MSIFNMENMRLVSDNLKWYNNSRFCSRKLGSFINFQSKSHLYLHEPTDRFVDFI